MNAEIYKCWFPDLDAVSRLSTLLPDREYQRT